jgi:hypothetical protein
MRVRESDESSKDKEVDTERVVSRRDSFPANEVAQFPANDEPEVSETTQIEFRDLDQVANEDLGDLDAGTGDDVWL